MTEPKQEYKTERNEPPNLREVKCCANCRHQVGWEECSCNKYYSATVLYGDLCDDYEP